MNNWQKIQSNPEKLSTFLMREKVIHFLREFFLQKKFHEVETPLLVAQPGTEPYLEVFKTTYKMQGEKNREAFLVTSPELQMKKLIAAGLKNIFQISKSFRNNEGRSKKHNSEFTILEYYRSGADYFSLMQDMDDLLLFLSKKTHRLEKNQVFSYQGKKYSFSHGCERLTVAQAFKIYAQIEADELLNKERLLAIAKNKGYFIDQQTTWEQAYNQIFLNEIEPYLGQKRPTLLYNYPREQAALAKLNQQDPRWAERVELYLAGLELANGFSELIIASEQEQRCQKDIRQRQLENKTIYDYDQDFIFALSTIKEPMAGMAIGVDRLIMLLADVDNIEEITFFPTGELFPPLPEEK